MRLLSPLLRQVVYPALGSAGYFRAGNSPLPAVVTYHGVVPDSYRINEKIPAGPLLKATNFRTQVQALKKHYTVISPQQFLAWLKDSEALPQPGTILVSKARGEVILSAAPGWEGAVVLDRSTNES